MAQDINSAFSKAQAMCNSGKGQKRVVTEVVNTVCQNTIPVTSDLHMLLSVQKPAEVKTDVKRKREAMIEVASMVWLESKADCPPLSRQYMEYFTANVEVEGEEEENEFDIMKILDQLHRKYLALNFPQYERSLHKFGITYLVTANMFNADFYIEKVGMPDGAAVLFNECVSKEFNDIFLARE